MKGNEGFVLLFFTLFAITVSSFFVPEPPTKMFSIKEDIERAKIELREVEDERAKAMGLLQARPIKPPTTSFAPLEERKEKIADIIVGIFSRDVQVSKVGANEYTLQGTMEQMSLGEVVSFVKAVEGMASVKDVQITVSGGSVSSSGLGGGNMDPIESIGASQQQIMDVGVPSLKVIFVLPS